MPVKLQAPVFVPVPPTHVHSAGKQEDFEEAGAQLAAALGWDGPPDHVGNGIAVADAQRFLTRSLHEHYTAGARGDAQPEPLAVCEHLAVEDAKEQTAVAAALSKVYESGKGAPLTAHPIVKADIGATLVLPISRAAELDAGLGKAG
jgi:hypothetical protein